MNKYKDLRVWQRAIDLSVQVHELTESKLFGTAANMMKELRENSIKIPCKIAKGAGLRHKSEFVDELGSAIGECYELESRFILAVKLGSFEEEETTEVMNEMSEIQRMLFSLSKSLLNPSNLKPRPKRDFTDQNEETSDSEPEDEQQPDRNFNN